MKTIKYDIDADGFTHNGIIFAVNTIAYCALDIICSNVVILNPPVGRSKGVELDSNKMLKMQAIEK